MADNAVSTLARVASRAFSMTLSAEAKFTAFVPEAHSIGMSVVKKVAESTSEVLNYF